MSVATLAVVEKVVATDRDIRMILEHAEEEDIRAVVLGTYMLVRTGGGKNPTVAQVVETVAGGSAGRRLHATATWLHADSRLRRLYCQDCGGTGRVEPSYRPGWVPETESLVVRKWVPCGSCNLSTEEAWRQALRENPELARQHTQEQKHWCRLIHAVSCTRKVLSKLGY